MQEDCIASAEQKQSKLGASEEQGTVQWPPSQGARHVTCSTLSDASCKVSPHQHFLWLRQVHPGNKKGRVKRKQLRKRPIVLMGYHGRRPPQQLRHMKGLDTGTVERYWLSQTFLSQRPHSSAKYIAHECGMR